VLTLNQSEEFTTCQKEIKKPCPAQFCAARARANFTPEGKNLFLYVRTYICKAALGAAKSKTLTLSEKKPERAQSNKFLHHYYYISCATSFHFAPRSRVPSLFLFKRFLFQQKCIKRLMDCFLSSFCTRVFNCT
jgi:hypothetical protein